MCVRITLLWLWLSILPFLFSWLQTGHSQYSGPPEVVIPLRVTGTDRGMNAPGWLSYSLHFGGQRHIVHMKAKKLLVARNLPVFTYTDQGALLEDHPFVPDNCYYHGHVEGDPESSVALNTCSGGFHGTLQINDTAYEIKPKRLSVTFEHLVYKMATEETQSPPMRCGLSEEEIAQQLKLRESDSSILMQSGYQGWWTHRWIIDLGLVVDNRRYVFLERNNSNVIEDVLRIVNRMNFLFSSLDLDMVITGLDIWDNQDLVTVSNDMPKVLDAFRRWKIGHFNSRVKNDIGHLISHQFYGGFLGLAYVGTVCNSHFNCGVNRAAGRSINAIAHTVAHEIGHNLGMKHDEQVRPCKCEQRVCIMAEADNHATKFSNCSYGFLWSTSRRSRCMHDIPVAATLHPPSLPHCGNGVVEQGEECDCGALELCEKDPCCLTDCTLRLKARCAFGLCCKNCTFMPSGTVCREKNNECDLPEWCNGTSHKCPEDVYVQNGMSCAGSGHCYEKKCVNRDAQCRQLFGKEARSANQTCYQEINVRGDRFGNCGSQGASYIRCHANDILCGRVQCENVTVVPSLGDHMTVHCTQINDSICWGTDYHFGMTIPDIGDVKDGTECGDKNMCIHRKCVLMPLWANDCSPKMCNMSGICNNKNHCHCDFGWHPPNCKIQGYGGSVDSGPPPVPPPPIATKNKLHIPYWLILFFGFFILWLLCLLFCLCKKNATNTPKKIIQTSPEK